MSDFKMFKKITYMNTEKSKLKAQKQQLDILVVSGSVNLTGTNNTNSITTLGNTTTDTTSIDMETNVTTPTNPQHDAKLPVVRSYFKNCGGCGKITTSDRWIEKTERNIKDHYRPICKKCAIWAELPVY